MRFKYICVYILAGWMLISSTPALANGSDLYQESSCSVLYQDDKLSVKANNCPLYKLLVKIADHSGFELVMYGSLKGEISIELKNVSLEEGLKSLDKNLDFLFVYKPRLSATDEFTIKEVYIYSDGANDSIKYLPNPPPISDSSKTDELEQDVLEIQSRDRPNVLDETSEFEQANVSVDDLAEQLLNDENPENRADAAMAIGALKQKEALSFLIEALNDDDPWVRLNVVENIALIGDDEVIKYLKQAAQDSDVDVSNAAIVALDELKEKTPKKK